MAHLISNNGDVTGNHGSSDNWFVKTDNNGNLLFERSFGGTHEDEGNCIIKTLDGGYVLAGFSNSNDGDLTANHGIDDFWMVKLNIAGNLQWQRSMGGANSDWAFSVVQSVDGGYALAGFAWSNDHEVVGNHNPGIPDFWVVKLNPGVLAVQLLEFTGRETTQGNELSWTTASETNNDHFTIERSTNGIDFSAIGNIKGNGNSELEHKYSFIDKDPLAGNNYYRLKQVNFDAVFTYSKTIRLVGNMKIIEPAKIYPNPVAPSANNLVIEYSIYDAEPVRITLVNSAGQVIMEKNKKEQPAGDHKEIVDVSGIAKGVYFIKLQAADHIITRKMIRD